MPVSAEYRTARVGSTGYMAKTSDNELFDRLRASGIRKRVARDLSSAANSARSWDASKTTQATIAQLRSILDELEDRARGAGGPASRSAAAKKAAATRKRKAAARSAAAKKGARTRARNAR